MTPKEVWVAEKELMLGGILLKGFHIREVNAAQVHREEHLCYERMIAILGKIYDEFNTPATLPFNPQKGKVS